MAGEGLAAAGPAAVGGSRGGLVGGSVGAADIFRAHGSTVCRHT
nr:MAG TPA: hypothetical protein [Caudoviricetes sp.]